MIQNVFFLRRAVVNDVLLPFRQLPEGHVGAHAHLPADVGHQRPHQAVPGSHRALIDGQGIIRHQRIPVHRAHDSRPVTGTAGSLAVEGKLLRGGRIEFFTALRAGQLLSRRHQQRGRKIMSVRAPVACQPGKHQPQAV